MSYELKSIIDPIILEIITSQISKKRNDKSVHSQKLQFAVQNSAAIKREQNRRLFIFWGLSVCQNET